MGVRVEVNGLVGVVIARHVAATAVETEVLVDERDHLLRAGHADVGDHLGATHGSELGDGGHLRLHHLQVVLHRFADLPSGVILGLGLASGNLVGAELGLLGAEGTVLGVVRALEIPALEVLAAAKVEEGLETRDEVVDDGEVLVHDGSADLQQGGATVDELQSHVGRVNATGAHDVDLGVFFLDGGDGAESKGTDVGATETTVAGLVVLADTPSHSVEVGLEADETGDGVDGGDTSSAGISGSLGNDSNVGNVGGELGKDGDLHGLADPADGLEDLVRVDAELETHALLVHAVRTGQVHLDHVSARLLRLDGELLPVLLGEASHDGGHDDVLGELGLEVADGVVPVVGVLLRDELDVHPAGLMHLEIG